MDDGTGTGKKVRLKINKSTKTALCVDDLQQRLPRARVCYVSGALPLCVCGCCVPVDAAAATPGVIHLSDLHHLLYNQIYTNNSHGRLQPQ